MGSQTVDQGHRLIIRVGPRAALRAIFAYALFLTGWIAAGWWGHSGDEPDFSGPSFWIPWLAVITWIGGYFLVVLVWGLFGRVLLIVTAESLEVRKELWRFARTKTYQAGLVRDVHPKLVPCSDDDFPRTDFGLRVLYAFDNFHVGEGMSQYEAQHVASTVLSRIRPGAR